jgi:hypothetical protein
VGDFLAFRRMLMPLLLQLFFWLGVLGCIGAGVFVIMSDPGTVTIPQQVGGVNTPDLKQLGDAKLYVGLLLIIGGPIVLRLYFELLMLPFRINGTLTEIRKLLVAQNSQKPAAPGPASHPVPLDPAPLRARR